MESPKIQKVSHWLSKIMVVRKPTFKKRWLDFHGLLDFFYAAKMLSIFSRVNFVQSKGEEETN